MSQFSCIVQAGSAAHARGDQLADRLSKHHAEHYPGEQASVQWRAIPPGHMFTEGRQSTSSIISCTVAHPTTLDRREAYMRGVCDLWTEITGCTDHEVVVALTEAVDVTDTARQE